VTFAEQFLAIWRDRTEPCDDPISWAKEIDPSVRTEGFLHTDRKRFIFSDRSQAILANGCLTVR